MLSYIGPLLVINFVIIFGFILFLIGEKLLNSNVYPVYRLKRLFHIPKSQDYWMVDQK